MAQKNQKQPSRNPNISLHWPTPILQKKFAKYQRVNPDLLALFQQHREQQLGRDDDRRFYASKDDLFKLYGEIPAIQALVKFFMDGVYEIASHVNAPYWPAGVKIDINITGLWFQMSNDYAFHETHVHGNCSWSGVYYVSAGDSATKLDKSVDIPNGVTRFYGPNMEASAGGFGDFGNFYLQDHSWDSYPEDGKLCVFPAHLKHMPFPYKGDSDRVIVSFHAEVVNPDFKGYGYSAG